MPRPSGCLPHLTPPLQLPHSSSLTTQTSPTTGSQRAFYYTPSTLIASGRTYLIHSSINTSLCLTFSKITFGMTFNGIRATAGFPLRFTPCMYTKSNGQPSYNSQVGQPSYNSQVGTLHLMSRRL